MFIKPKLWTDPMDPDSPARLLKVRGPGGRPLRPEGEHVPDGDLHWARCLRDGDIEIADPPAVIPSGATSGEGAGDAALGAPHTGTSEAETSPGVSLNGIAPGEKIGELVADGAVHAAEFTGGPPVELADATAIAPIASDPPAASAA